MAIWLLFRGSPRVSDGERLPGTEAWRASARVRGAIQRNLDAGVLAIMLAGCALVASHLLGDAVATVQVSAGWQRSLLGSGEPHVAVARKACVAREDARVPTGAAN